MTTRRSTPAGPHTLLAIDRGRASTSVAVLARIHQRWRLAASSVLPATVATEDQVARTIERLRSADPALASEIGLGEGSAVDIERTVVRSRVPSELAVLTVTERGQAHLAPIVAASGWRATPASIETHDARGMTALLLEPAIHGVLAAADRRAGADERGGLDDLGALLVGIAARRPDLPIVLSGAMTEQAARFETGSALPPQVVLAADPSAGDPPGELLRNVLAGMAEAADDARRHLAHGIEVLAEVLDRRVELLEVGASGAIRAVADPPAAGAHRGVRSGVVATAALVPPDIDEATLDGVARWTTTTLDRHRLRDRLADLALYPWGDAAGDGARLRMAAARAALTRLVEATPFLSTGPTPDVVVLAGGTWAVAPASAISLAVADVLRRPAAFQVAYDHARLLAPLGAMRDRPLARSILTDVVDDLLVPLGSVVMPSAVRSGRITAALTIDPGTGDGPARIELDPGGIGFVDLPPGLVGRADFSFRDAVDLGGRGRRFGIDIAGGLGGLLVDLRGIPLALPARSDRRRELLRGWQDAVWPGIEP